MFHWTAVASPGLPASGLGTHALLSIQLLSRPGAFALSPELSRGFPVTVSDSQTLHNQLLLARL